MIWVLFVRVYCIYRFCSFCGVDHNKWTRSANSIGEQILPDENSQQNSKHRFFIQWNKCCEIEKKTSIIIRDKFVINNTNHVDLQERAGAAKRLQRKKWKNTGEIIESVAYHLVPMVERSVNRR